MIYVYNFTYLKKTVEGALAAVSRGFDPNDLPGSPDRPAAVMNHLQMNGMYIEGANGSITHIPPAAIIEVFAAPVKV